jgi:hypothetical protein
MIPYIQNLITWPINLKNRILILQAITITALFLFYHGLINDGIDSKFVFIILTIMIKTSCARMALMSLEINQKKEFKFQI